MNKQAWYYDNGSIWQAWGSDAVEMICGPIDEFHGKSIVADHNALLDVPDPEASMVAHRKLVEEAQKVADVRHKVEQALIDKCAVADIPTTVADLQAALAAVKEASDD